MRNVNEIVRDLKHHPERVKSDELRGLREVIAEYERTHAVPTEQLREAK